MTTLTTSEIKKITKAQKLMAEALELLNSVDRSNNEFRYSSNKNTLVNSAALAIGIVEDILNEKK